MRRINTGELRVAPLALVTGKSKGPARPAVGTTPDRPRESNSAASHITVLPVTVATSTRVDEAAPLGELRNAVGMITAGASIPAASVNRALLNGRHADVILLDARHARPSSVYRAIARLRSEGWTRGVVLMVDPAEMPIVPVCLSVGATDFVLSSASRPELEARMRRQAVGESAPGTDVPHAGIGGEIQLHWRTHEVSFEGRRISLTLREMQLLDAVMERGERVITAPDLARLAWGRTGGSGAFVTTYVCSLRKKLAWFGGRFGICTVRGVGYRFVV